MYGYRTNNAILTTFMNWMLKQDPVDLKNKMPFDLLYINANILLKNKYKNLDFVRHQLLHLQLEGYFEFDDIRNKKDEITGLMVSITTKGISSHTGNVFQIKQDEVFWKRFIDTAITVANIVVAITAAWVIIQGYEESKELKGRLQLLEEQVRQLKGATNPNSGHLQNYYETKNQDSVKKDSIFSK